MWCYFSDFCIERLLVFLIVYVLLLGFRGLILFGSSFSRMLYSPYITFLLSTPWIPYFTTCPKAWSWAKSMPIVLDSPCLYAEVGGPNGSLLTSCGLELWNCLTADRSVLFMPRHSFYWLLLCMAVLNIMASGFISSWAHELAPLEVNKRRTVSDISLLPSCFPRLLVIDVTPWL